MKKKILYSLMALIALTFMGVTFSSCSDDDEPKLEDAITPDPTNPVFSDAKDNKVIGTWVNNESEKDEEGSWTETETVVFQSDGRFLIDWVEYLDGKIYDSYWYSGFWSADGSKLKLYCTNSSDAEDDDPEIGDTGTYSYVVVGEKLVFRGNEYTRK